MAHKISDDVSQVLRAAVCQKDRLILNGQLDRVLYQKVNKVLEISGFQWSRKEKCHLAIKGTAADTLAAALEEGQIVDPKKEWDFFETPEDLADRMAKILDIKPGESVLEPSAGGGRLVRAALSNGAEYENLFAIEAQKDLRLALAPLCRVFDRVDDFVAACSSELKDERFDKISMNPPFSSLQDLAHCRLAYDLLKTGGRMVCITGPSWQYRSDKKSVAFKQWIEDVGAEVEELPAGTFKDSGTSVRSLLLVINKK